MPVVDLKAQLANLLQLQAIDTQIYNFKAEKQAKPEEIRLLEDNFAAKQQGLQALEKRSLDAQKKKKDKELELATKEEAVKKLQTQLYSLKTNKEYQTMLQQINDAKADGSLIEDQILAAMDEIDQVKVQIDKEKKVLQEEEQKTNSEKKKIEDRIKEIDDRLAQLEGQRQQIIPQIEKNILSQYDRILSSRDGLAIVMAKDNSCKGCNMFVPPQVINLIRMYERIITCEVCNRMLYVGDE